MHHHKHVGVNESYEYTVSRPGFYWFIIIQIHGNLCSGIISIG